VAPLPPGPAAAVGTTPAELLPDTSCPVQQHLALTHLMVALQVGGRVGVGGWVGEGGGGMQVWLAHLVHLPAAGGITGMP
jgi:hypothetical protein